LQGGYLPLWGKVGRVAHGRLSKRLPELVGRRVVHGSRQVRNSGWYIPFWRKPKRQQGDGQQQERPEKRRRSRQRSDEDLERVRDDWVNRYRGRVQALHTLRLSVGTPTEEIDARYQQLVSELAGSPEAEDRRRRLRQAYDILKQE
ncbi:MAG: hypothetical protein ACRDIE_07925, partial [Chloroflexota bacterium]